MKRGEVWTVSGSGYSGKPRPAVIIQDGRFDVTSSITICAFTAHEIDAPIFRIPVAPREDNGLRFASWLMVDKLSTVSKDQIGTRIGRLENADMNRLNQAVLVFLGLA